MAAWDQGKFWEMHERLLEEAPALGRPILDGLAREIGLDMRKYLGAMDTASHLEELRGNLERIHELDIWSTPTVIVNGRVITGAQAYGKYKEIIDEALAQ